MSVTSKQKKPATTKEGENETAVEDSKPGWLYDIHSGQCAGPASYEQAAVFKASGGKPIRTTYAGCPCAYTIRPRKTGPKTGLKTS